MSLSVLAGFAGVLVAAAAAGLLVGHCVRHPRMDFILWAGAALGLTAALGAEIVGFTKGFSPLTFRVVQLGAQLAAPLWLAWGLVEVVARREAVRFGTRLVSAALTVLGGVIVATDPLTATPFTKKWPPADAHFQIIAHYMLLMVQVLAVIAALSAVAVGAARARSGRAWQRALPGVGAAGVAVLAAVGVRLSLPANSAYPLLCAAAAGLAWFAMTRVRGLDALTKGTGRGAGRDRSDAGVSRDGHEPGDSESEAAMRGRRGRDRDENWDDAVRDRRGGYERDQAPWGSADRPGQGYQRGESDAGYADSGYPDSGYPDPGYPDPGYPDPGYQDSRYRDSGYENSRYADSGYPDSGRRDSGYPRSGYPENGYADSGYAAGQGTRTPGRQPSFSPAAPADKADPLTAGSGRSAQDFPAAAPTAQYGRLSAPQGADPGSGPEFTPAAASGATAATAGAVSSRPYGRISIFTLLDDKVADFDRLAEQAAEGVRTAEPDTLVYVIHVVPKAPMQRIFYEIYRDRSAFESHERQPHILRFAAERRSCVLATNIIELRLKYAKVAPVPAAAQQSQPAVSALEPGTRSIQSSARPAPQPGGWPGPEPGPEPGARPAPRPQSPGWGQPSYPGQRPGGR